MPIVCPCCVRVLWSWSPCYRIPPSNPWWVPEVRRTSTRPARGQRPRQGSRRARQCAARRPAGCRGPHRRQARGARPPSSSGAAGVPQVRAFARASGARATEEHSTQRAAASSVSNQSAYSARGIATSKFLLPDASRRSNQIAAMRSNMVQPNLRKLARHTVRKLRR